MKKHEAEQGSINVLLVPVVLLAVFFIAASAFAWWAFSGRQDFKNNSDAKVAAAVAANKQQVQTADAKQYAEAAKNPLKTYVGPDAYGSIHVTYPKTWSSYVDTTNSSTPLDAYFHTDYVPSVQSNETYNLRVQVVAQSYSRVMTQYGNYVTTGKATATPYALPKVPGVSGTILTGQILQGSNNTAQATMVLIPMRDKTLKVWTESPSYLADFNTYILPNLTFSP